MLSSDVSDDLEPKRYSRPTASIVYSFEKVRPSTANVVSIDFAWIVISYFFSRLSRVKLSSMRLSGVMLWKLATSQWYFSLCALAGLPRQRSIAVVANIAQRAARGIAPRFRVSVFI